MVLVKASFGTDLVLVQLQHAQRSGWWRPESAVVGLEVLATVEPR